MFSVMSSVRYSFHYYKLLPSDKEMGGGVLYMFCALICLNCGRQNIDRQDTAVFLCFVLVTYDGMAVKRTHL